MREKHTVSFAIFLLWLLLSLNAVCCAAWRETARGTRYFTDAHTYVKNRWKKIDGKRYYFDKNGFLQTGRIKAGGRYYYVTRKKGMLQNKKVGWYYYGSDGAMVKNCWQKWDGGMYYFGRNGRMKVGQFTVGKRTYYCDKYTGRVTSKEVDGFYYNHNGVMVKNRWVNRYYHGADGKVVYGKLEIDGKYYYCTKKDGMVISRWHRGNYYGQDGVMAVNCWIGYGTNRSYVDENGVITRGNKHPKDPPSEEDVRLLAALVYYESGNQPYEGMVAVASVVVNRMESSLFPDTLREVIYQSGQFDPVSNGLVTLLYNSEEQIQKNCVKAAREVLNEGSKLEGYFYFNNFYGICKIGDHYFS